MELESINEVQRYQKRKGVQKRKLIPRGNGKSYGDAALNHGTVAISSLSQNRIIEFDEANKLILLESGVLIKDLLNFLIPKGFTIPVVPGSRFISIGGCLASDVHGKNHVTKGSFSNIVNYFILEDPKGNSRKIDLNTSPEVFRATCGGMGLTGYISLISLRVEQIFGNCVETMSTRTRNLNHTLQILKKQSNTFEFNLAWVNFNSKKEFGKGIVYSSNLVHKNVNGFNTSGKMLKFPNISMNIFNSISVKLLNFVKYNLRKSIQIKIQSLWEVYFPSDILLNWNKLFGKSGLHEYQFVIPFENESKIHEITTEISNLVVPILSAIKIFGNQNNNYMSFPKDGFVVGITFHWKDELKTTLHKLDTKILDLGCRKYLSKDSYTSGDILRNMYPMYNEFIAQKKQLDPENQYSSGLFERLSQ